ncbi:DUF6692 family protein [Chelativorans sp. AA-79]|uniref:DUF6692 family protein n=1 Tax=Chelativorans sp. AA-79 TaxID=3028735 RepID=UPI0023F6C0B1|nr:DUF6692 family protein [Chelativorans sp. AA-79]WEX07874.1 hypothetical protein PVE73_17475 [Chelativorans sp. AA-79]
MRSRSSRGLASLLALILASGLSACGESDAPDDELHPVRSHEVPRVVPAGEAVSGLHIPTLDPETMNDAEVSAAIGPGSRCEFRYTSYGRPILAVKATPDGAAEGAVKLGGNLVVLRSPSSSGELLFSADQVRMSLLPDGEASPGETPEEATSVFEVGDSLRVGYRGYYRCTG